VSVLHVAAKLEDEHPAVAVEGDLSGLFDVGIGEHWFELEPVRQPEPLRLFRSRQRQHRRLLREVRLHHRGPASAAGLRALSGWWYWRRRGRTLCRRIGSLSLSDHRERRNDERAGNKRCAPNVSGSHE